MHVNGDKLDNRDSYESDWIGGYGGNDPQLLSGQGRPVVGLIGRENARECTGLGLCVSSTDPPSVVPPPDASPCRNRPSKPCRTARYWSVTRGWHAIKTSPPKGACWSGSSSASSPLPTKNPFAPFRRSSARARRSPSLASSTERNSNASSRWWQNPAMRSAMSVRNSNADGVKLTFMRIKDGQLDPSDSYDSGIVGEQRPDGWTNLTGDGHPVVGIIGSAEERSNLGLGLLFSHAGNGWRNCPSCHRAGYV